MISVAEKVLSLDGMLFFPRLLLLAYYLLVWQSWEFPMTLVLHSRCSRDRKQALDDIDMAWLHL